MRAGNFFKKIAFVLSFVFTLFSIGYAIFLNAAVEVPLDKAFYFLTAEGETVEVCAMDVTKSGGAGFLLKTENQTKVAVSVYFKEIDALNAKEKNLKNYDNLSLSVETISKLYIKRDSAKNSAQKIKACFDGLYAHILALDGIITRLEKGGTQEEIKTILQTLFSNFKFLSVSSIPLFSRDYARAATYLEEEIFSKGVVTLSSLRYLTCDLCASFISAANAYSL